MKRIAMSLAALAVAGTCLQSVCGQGKSGAEDLMKRKLERSQKVLEGLALRDFDRIAQNAEELILLSKQVGWRVFKTAQYETYSNEFRSNAEDLVKQAKIESLDGAALAYVELTLTCVKCHKHVREKRMAQLDVPHPAVERSVLEGRLR